MKKKTEENYQKLDEEVKSARREKEDIAEEKKELRAKLI